MNDKNPTRPTDAEIMALHCETLAAHTDGRGYDAAIISAGRALLARYGANQAVDTPTQEMQEARDELISLYLGQVTPTLRNDCHRLINALSSRIQTAVADADRWRWISAQYDGMKTSEVERFLELLGLDASEPYAPLGEFVDAATREVPQPAASEADDIPDFSPGNGNKARRRAAALRQAGPTVSDLVESGYLVSPAAVLISPTISVELPDELREHLKRELAKPGQIVAADPADCQQRVADARYVERAKRFQQRANEIEVLVGSGKMDAAQCFTQMRQLVPHPTDACAETQASDAAQVRRDTLLSVLGTLNSNPYNLTKTECVDLVRGMFNKADAALVEGQKIGGAVPGSIRDLVDAYNASLAPYAATGATYPNPNTEPEPRTAEDYDLPTPDAAPPTSGADTELLPTFLRSRMTPWGMLVRACRIIVGDTLMGMSKPLSMSPAELSAYECDRKEPSDEIVLSVMRYFEGRGLCIPATAWRKAVRANKHQRG